MRIHLLSKILLHIFTSSSDTLKISYFFVFKIIVFTSFYRRLRHFCPFFAPCKTKTLVWASD
nr:MAG TPA: hypothetical protein [Caudoviricetes sp.]